MPSVETNALRIQKYKAELAVLWREYDVATRLHHTAECERLRGEITHAILKIYIASD